MWHVLGSIEIRNRFQWGDAKGSSHLEITSADERKIFVMVLER